MLPETEALPAAEATASSCVVIKIGSSSLVEGAGVDAAKADVVAAMVRRLRDEGLTAVVVASGAIALGRSTLGEGPGEAGTRRQVMAALGQGPHFQAVGAAFARQGLTSAQFLLTPRDIWDPEHGVSVRAALLHTLAAGVVPVVNENDAIMVRNNDVLAALLAARLGARTLMLLTDVDGLYDRNPRLHPDARRIDVVDAITAGLEAAATGADSAHGTGGMAAKLGAARIATRSGVPTVIARFDGADAAVEAYRGRPRGTLVRASKTREGLHSLWCAFAQPPAAAWSAPRTARRRSPRADRSTGRASPPPTATSRPGPSSTSSRHTVTSSPAAAPARAPRRSPGSRPERRCCIPMNTSACWR